MSSDVTGKPARFGGVRYSAERNCLVDADGAEVVLRPKSLAVFRQLAERPGAVVEKAELMSGVWRDRAVTDDSLVQCVADIRRALDDGDHAVLRTITRRGYMLVADAPAAIDTAAGEPPDAEAGPPEATGSSEPADPVAASRGGLGRWAALGTLALVLGVAAALLRPVRDAAPDPVLDPAPDPAPDPATPTGPARESVVGHTVDGTVRREDDRVALALVGGGAPTGGLLADVLAETRLGLGRYRTVRLVPRERAERVLALSDASGGPTGRRLLVELSDPADGELLYSEAYPIDDEALGGVGDGGVARELAVRVAAIASPGGGAIMRAILQGAAGKPVEALDRRECLALGFECTTCSGELSTVTPRAVACLANALEEDPDDARAWALHGSVLANQYWWGDALVEPARSTPAARADLPARAIEAGNRAEALSDGGDAAVYWSLALGHAAACEADALQDAVERGLRLNPDDPNMLGAMGNWLAYNGRWEEGVRLAKRAIEIQPAHHERFWHYAIAKDHYRRGEWQQAFDAFMRAFDERNWLNHLQLAYTLPHLGRIDEARREVAEVQRLFPGLTVERVIEFYRMFCFDDAYLDTIEGALTRAGLASRGDASDRGDVRMPRVRVLRANGIDIEYLDIGEGEPVVFVHGSNTDYRAWAHFELPVSERHRFVAYSRRYHGTQPWPDGGEGYSRDVHTEDLIAFVEALDAGPVHLVGWSNGAVHAPLAALRRPDLVRSLVLYEPNNPELLPDGPGSDEIRAGFAALWAPVVETLATGDVEAAAKRFLEAAFQRESGHFETESMGLRQVVLDNARALPADLGAGPPAATERLDCARLSGLATPTLVVTGGAHSPDVGRARRALRRVRAAGEARARRGREPRRSGAPPTRDRAAAARFRGRRVGRLARGPGRRHGAGLVGAAVTSACRAGRARRPAVRSS